jgi:AraC-like DNA-binding protein
LSDSRHSEDAFAVRTLAITYRDHHQLESHSHPWAQLVYAASGVMRVTTPEASWLVPPTRAIWMPPRVPHAIAMRGSVAMRTLYLAPELGALPSACRVLEVAPLLRELILHVVRLGMLDVRRPAHERLAGLLLDLLATEAAAPLGLPLPSDPRARGLAEKLLAEPGSQATLDVLAKGAGASLRTLQRLFPAETGLSLEAWRAGARMQHAVVLLATGHSVTETALASGYQGASAFVAAFKRSVGVTPSRYRAGTNAP